MQEKTAMHFARVKDVHAHYYCAFLLHMLYNFIRYVHATSYIKRAPSKTLNKLCSADGHYVNLVLESGGGGGAPI